MFMWMFNYHIGQNVRNDFSLIDLKKDQSFFYDGFSSKAPSSSTKECNLPLLNHFNYSFSHYSSHLLSFFSLSPPSTPNNAHGHTGARPFLTQLKVIKDWRREIRWEDNKERAQLQMARHRIQRVFFSHFLLAQRETVGAAPSFWTGAERPTSHTIILLFWRCNAIRAFCGSA